MAYTVTKVEMWTGELDDRVGGLAAKLKSLADAGSDLEVVVARRQAHQPGKGVVFVGPIKGPKAQDVARKAGFTKSADLVALRVEGPNQPGECYRLAQMIADAGINMRGLAATAAGDKFILSLGFDSEADANNAAAVVAE